MTAVEVQDLVVSLGGGRLVDGVSFALPAGEVTALVGESGSGKTTTGLALLGEHPPGAVVEGRIEIAGSDEDRPVVGHIPQQPSAALNPVRRIGPVLTEMALRHTAPGPRGERRRVARERVLEALRRAQLPEEALRRYPHQLSGGQQQRVVLAQALVCRPRVVVADEPTTGQDALTREQIVEELRVLTAQGIAVLLLTHDLDVVRSLADQVLVMCEGRIVEAGQAKSVLSSPEHEYTRRLVASQPSGAVDPVPARTGEPLLSVRDLVAGHGKTNTLRDVTLDIGAGERIAVVGRSGSGKTTLARCVAGLHPRRAGEIVLDGEGLSPRLRGRTREQLARVQYVFQDARASFNEFVPVVDQVARTAERLRGTSRPDARSRALAMLERVGLAEDAVRRRPMSLSGGELQRAALVRALLAEPDLLICDEITSGLDTVTQAGILQLLRELQDGSGCALLLITHDLAVVAEIAERVAVVDQGEIVETGSTAEVLRAPRHPVTSALARASGEVVNSG
ncbi:ABC transporter ATP-binding protein [Saccharopolyspora taberi]|uniref:ABC transporter ATP-binding protein n=1 Tax=Saccharopolyspora taberi TaxID=60895 RepID=A0ABN3VBP1_9PSEU